MSVPAQVTLDQVTVLFEQRRSRLRRRLISGHSVGGELVSYKGAPHVAALREVTAQLKPGSRTALIGSNGAGKTTLLRTIAGVYEPQGGDVQASGRIATLFSNAISLSDYETGRQNLELTGLLRGMTLEQTRGRMQEILEFTRLDQFLDQPLTAYSEGMKTRLGFAMAALSDPEILLIDETLNTSDVAFIESARRRIKAFTAPDRIVVIASHAREVLLELCTDALWLEHGRVVRHGPIRDVCAEFDESRAAAK